MKKILYCGLLLLVLSACGKNTKSGPDSYEYFSKELKADMSYSQLVARFGAPDEDKGSGIHIYVYHLQDDTQIWIGYTDKILYAKHVNSSGQVLHTLI